jgi:hypothetical protein
MGTPAVLIRKSTGEILKHADYPREDMQPISGLDPDLEWLIKTQPCAEPDYDSRIFILNRVEAITSIPHPEYNWLNQYQITFNTPKRPAADIQTSVINAENDANNQVFPFTEQLKLITLGIATIFREVSGMKLTTSEQEIKNKILALAVKIWKNDVALKTKVAEITSGLEPNIDEGWEKTGV